MEILWGLLCGLGCIIPGWGLGLSLLFAVLGPEGSGVYAIVSGLVFNSLIEAESPIFSGNIYTGVFNYRLKLNSGILFSLILKYKVIAWVIGVGVGLILPPLLGVKGLTVTWFFTIYLLWKLGRDWNLGVLWIIGVKMLMSICELGGLLNPIVVISIVLFIIPSVIGGGEDEEISGSVDYEGSPNWITVWWSSLLSLAAPGVSPAAVTTTLEENTGFVSAYLSTLVVEVVIEAIALGQSVKGESLGKALISGVVVVPSVEVVILSIGLLFSAAGIALLIQPYVNYDVQSLKIVSGFISAIALVALAGLWAIPLGIAGFCLSLLGKKLGSSGKGLTFVALLV